MSVVRINAADKILDRIFLRGTKSKVLLSKRCKLMRPDPDDHIEQNAVHVQVRVGWLIVHGSGCVMPKQRNGNLGLLGALTLSPATTGELSTLPWVGNVQIELPSARLTQ